MKSDIEEMIYEETEKRLTEMGREDYRFPDQAGKGDYIAIIVLMALCLILIIGCMTGGIQ